MSGRDELWPRLPLQEWKETYETIHMWFQIVGKITLRHTAYVNHWWNTAFYVSSRGLRTAIIPFAGRAFDIEFDFIDHVLVIRTDTGSSRAIPLYPRTVSEFHGELMSVMKSLSLPFEIDRDPKEVPNPIPFDQDTTHASYDAEYASRHWRILVQADRVLKRFRGEFIGKCSPVHFFWGSFDHTVTRFSGRRAPARPGADHITQLAYSHEVSSCGFWPGNAAMSDPAFYAYAAPEPAGFKESKVLPSVAFYNEGTKGFILPYEEVRTASNPDTMILEFCRSTYEAAADLGNWDRQSLEAPVTGRKREAA